MRSTEHARFDYFGACYDSAAKHAGPSNAVDRGSIDTHALLVTQQHCLSHSVATERSIPVEVTVFEVVFIVENRPAAAYGIPHYTISLHVARVDARASATALAAAVGADAAKVFGFVFRIEAPPTGTP